jgi:hypothetical protein
MAGTRWRGFPPPRPVRVGGGPRAKATYCTTALDALDKKEMFSGFANSEPSLLGGDGTDFDGIAVQSAGHGGSLAGLLVQRSQSRLVGSVQNINLLAHD